MDSKEKYKAIGLMSGTSMDGVDLAYSTYAKKGRKWGFGIKYAVTVPYPAKWKKILSEVQTLSGEELLRVHSAYGQYLGHLCAAFIKKFSIRKADFISSHGHTVFHQPQNGFTFQLGDGNAIHTATGLPVIYDFRSLDVTRGGQGAPLVPVGDQLLFGEYEVCLNLGGIANLSLQEKRRRIAFDVCFANMGLNYLAEKAGKPIDENGNLASEGEVDIQLLKALNKFYQQIRNTRPSLGRELFEAQVRPLLDQNRISVADRLTTFTESIAIGVTHALSNRKGTVLCTGGGTFNGYLMHRLMEYAGNRVRFIVPDKQIVKFKEALVFGFLGVLRLRGEVNCLKSVTGAGQDSSSGVKVGL